MPLHLSYFLLKLLPSLPVLASPPAEFDWHPSDIHIMLVHCLSEIVLALMAHIFEGKLLRMYSRDKVMYVKKRAFI